MSSEALSKRKDDRADVLKAKILNFLLDGQTHGQREIQRETSASPTTVNEYLKSWTRDGIVRAVMIGKQGKEHRYQITQQGRDEHMRLTEVIIMYKKSRLTSRIVHMTIPMPNASLPPALVIVGATKGTPSPLSLSTQGKTSDLLKPAIESILKVQDYLKPRFLEVRFTIGSPPLTPEKRT